MTTMSYGRSGKGCCVPVGWQRSACCSQCPEKTWLWGTGTAKRAKIEERRNKSFKENLLMKDMLKAGGRDEGVEV